MTQRVPILLLLAIVVSACSTSNGAAPGQSGGFGGAIGSFGQGGMTSLGGAKGMGASTMAAAGGIPVPGSGGSGIGGVSSPGGGTGPVGMGGAPGAGGHMGMCNNVFVDCNGNTADGCETNTDTDAMNCGGCGKACPAAPNATPYCFVGQCHYGCAPGFGDCNDKDDDGCEVNLRNDKNNCGSCRFSCMDTECLNGGCKCAGSSVKPKKVPLDMYIVFDQSESMNQAAGNGTKWTVITGALTSFAQNMASAGIGVGLGYFPWAVPAAAPTMCTADADCKVNGANYGTCVLDGTFHAFMGCSQSDFCTASNYTPEVPIGTLPGVAPAIMTSLGMHMPVGLTPTYPALQGGYAYTKMWAANHPDHKTILVLATDGDPTACDASTNTVNTIAQQLVAPANSGAQPVLTFVIGVGTSLTSLNAIAQAGGTMQALIVDTGSADPGGDFLAAMKKIGASPAIGCQYMIPMPAMGMFDPTKVNVQLTPEMGTPTILTHVGSKMGCTPTTGGWYYDNNTTPTQIILCDSTCTGINSGTSVQVDVVLGCATQG